MGWGSRSIRQGCAGGSGASGGPGGAPRCFQPVAGLAPVSGWEQGQLKRRSVTADTRLLGFVGGQRPPKRAGCSYSSAVTGRRSRADGLTWNANHPSVTGCPPVVAGGRWLGAGRGRLHGGWGACRRRVRSEGPGNDAVRLVNGSDRQESTGANEPRIRQHRPGDPAGRSPFVRRFRRAPLRRQQGLTGNHGNPDEFRGRAPTELSPAHRQRSLRTQKAILTERRQFRGVCGARRLKTTTAALALAGRVFSGSVSFRTLKTFNCTSRLLKKLRWDSLPKL